MEKKDISNVLLHTRNVLMMESYKDAIDYVHSVIELRYICKRFIQNDKINQEININEDLFRSYIETEY